MAISAKNTNIDWDQFTEVRSFVSNNPVFCLTNAAGEKLYVKFVNKDEALRSQFATKVIRGIGLQSYKSRIVSPQYKVDNDGFVVHTPGSEWWRISQKIESLVESSIGCARANFSKVDSEYHILIMDNVEENRNIGRFQEVGNVMGHGILTLMNQPKFIHDVGRMIAADAVLGNFDRISYQHYGVSQAKFHIGNFFVNPIDGGIIPIDNDAIIPVPESEDIRFLIGGTRGGIFSGDQLPSMDKILSPAFSVTAVRTIMESQPWFRDAVAATGTDMNPFCNAVADSIKAGVREIIAKLKQNGEAKGFYKRLKAMMEKNDGKIAGLNYEGLKVKMRYAMLITDPDNPLTEDDAALYTTDYNKYRIWKSQVIMDEGSLISNDALPTDPFFPEIPSDMFILFRTLRKMKTGIGSLLNTEYSKAVAQAHTEKQHIRNTINWDMNELRSDIAKLKQEIIKPKPDRSVKKAYAEAVILFITLDMIYIKLNIIDPLIERINNLPVSRFTPLYINTIRKHLPHIKAQAENILQQYNAYCIRLAGGHNSQIIKDMNQAKEQLRIGGVEELRKLSVTI